MMKQNGGNVNISKNGGKAGTAFGNMCHMSYIILYVRVRNVELFVMCFYP